MTFKDLEKAFDKINWNTIFEILQKSGLKFMARKDIHEFKKINSFNWSSEKDIHQLCENVA